MKQRSAQLGAALLTAMVIVTLIATLAAAMVWQQWQSVQVEAAERAQSQAQWILNGAVDWARLILREDGAPDDLNEPWAQPLAETRLSTFLSNDGTVSDDAPEAFLSGGIRDAQARYNLRNVVVAGKVQPAELKVLQRLCEAVGLSTEWAGRIAQALKAADPGGAEPSRGPPGERQAGEAPPVTTESTVQADQGIYPTNESQLLWLGLDSKALAPLLPHIVILPKRTPVNLNTAGKEVLAAVLGGIDLASAERLVQYRQRQPLRAAGDARSIVGEQATPNPDQVAVSSNYFEVTGVLRLDQLVVAQRSLVERQGRNVRLLHTERIRNINTSLQQ